MRRISAFAPVASVGVVLTPRRRAAIAVLVTWPLAYFWVEFALTTVKGLVYYPTDLFLRYQYFSKS